MLVDASLLVRLLLTPGLQRGGAIFRFINEPTKEGAYVDEKWTVPLRDYVDRGGAGLPVGLAGVCLIHLSDHDSTKYNYLSIRNIIEKQEDTQGRNLSHEYTLARAFFVTLVASA